jgi:hypothetical protein
MDSRCPRKLTNLPTEECPEGRKAVDAARRGEEAGCPWFVADQESCYCCWKYLADNGRPTPVAQVARLCMISDKEVKQTIGKFKKKFEDYTQEDNEE